MTTQSAREILAVDVEPGAGAFECLRDGLLGAVAGQAGRVLVDLSRVDPVDGAMLSILASAAKTLGPSARVAVVASSEVAGQLAEWRLDTIWLVFGDVGAALEALGAQDAV